MILGAKRSRYILGYIYALTALVVQADCACLSSAFFSSSGNSFPRAEALWRIPRHAFGLK